MPKTKFLSGAHKATISIEKQLHRASQRHAKELNLQGGFSELLTRLLIRHINYPSQNISLLDVPRSFRQKRADAPQQTAAK